MYRMDRMGRLFYYTLTLALSLRERGNKEGYVSEEYAG